MLYMETDCTVCGNTFSRPVRTITRKKYLSSVPVTYLGPRYCSRACMNNRKTFSHIAPAKRIVYGITTQ